MKAAAFAYARATSVANALELLAVHEQKARVGALTRRADLLKSSDIVRCAPLPGPAVAHRSIRPTPNLTLTAGQI
jgi:carbon-monoxide dehydrogenase medium subunit